MLLSQLPELKQLLTERGLRTSGNKAELIERLSEDMSSSSASTASTDTDVSDSDDSSSSSSSNVSTGTRSVSPRAYTFEELQPNNSSGTGVAEGSSERLAEAVMRAQAAVRAFTQNIGGINGSGSGIHTIGIGNSNGLSHAQFEQNSTGTNAQQQQLPSMSAEERATNNAALIEVRMHITSLVIARTDCVELADFTCSR